MLELVAFGLILLALWAAYEISESLERWSSGEKTIVMWLLAIAFVWVLAEIARSILLRLGAV